MQQNDLILTVKDVMTYLKISRQTLHELTKSGQIPSYKVGKAVRYRKDEIDEFLKKQRKIIEEQED